MPPIVKTEHLTFIYNEGMPDATAAIKDVNFEMEENTFLGLIGPTGCGKSTLITHFNGLLKPTSGKVYIAGEDIWREPKDIRRFRFMAGLVFQYPEYQLFGETVEKDIAFGPTNMGLSAGEVDERVRTAARFCGIDEDMLKKSPFDLSGGQKRRAAIAGVLAMRPRLLILDEPAAGLDPEGRDTILNQVSRFHKETGTSVILVSHSMDDVAKYAGQILVMQNGGVSMKASTNEVFSHAEELLDMGLAVPQITKVFLKLREKGLDIETDVYTQKYGAEAILRYAEKMGVSPGGAGEGVAAAPAEQPPREEDGNAT